MASKVHMDEVFKKYSDGFGAGEVVLDVRDRDEYAEGHVPGAINIPVDDLLQRAGELKKFKSIYVHCGGGGRAGRACTALENAGVKNVYHVAGSGMRSWKEAGHPVEK